MGKTNKNLGLMLFLVIFCILAMPFSQNVFAAGNAGETVELQVNQSFFVDLTDQYVSADFTYTLTPQDPSSPMPEGSVDGVYTFKMTNQDSVKIPITFQNAGTYKYDLRQIIDENKIGYVYDSEVFTITVMVRNKVQNTPGDNPFPELGSGGNSNLQLIVYAQGKDGNKRPDLNFDTEYNPIATDPNLMVDPPVRKTVKGTPPKDAEFIFKLTAAEKSYPMPEGSVDGIKTMTIIGEGEKDFGTWSYDVAGTYLYTITEEKGNDAGYTYDTIVYTITDIVTDVNGQLVLNRTVTHNGNLTDACNFVNIYNGDSSDVPTDDSSDNDITNGGGDGNDGGGGSGPKTGDDSKLWFWGIAFAVSLVIAIGCKAYLVIEKRKKSQNDE